MEPPISIAIKQAPFWFARPEIVAPLGVYNNRTFTFDPKSTKFEITIDIKEDSLVKASDWERHIMRVTDALGELPHIESLDIKVTYHQTPKVIDPPSSWFSSANIPATVIEMVTENFGRLRGVAHATVSGIRDGPSEGLVRKMTEMAVPKSRKRKVEGEDEAVESGRYNLRPRRRH